MAMQNTICSLHHTRSSYFSNKERNDLLDISSFNCQSANTHKFGRKTDSPNIMKSHNKEKIYPISGWLHTTKKFNMPKNQHLQKGKFYN